MKVLFTFLFMLAFKDRVFSITPEKLFISERNNTYYVETDQKYDWFESFAKCARMNMALTAFESKIKWNDVLAMIQKQLNEQVFLWVSGYAVGEKRQFMWMTTGEEFTFTNWTVGNPDFRDQKEYCVHIANGAFLGWNDIMCTKKFGFICEFKNQQCHNLHSVKNFNFYFPKH